MHSKTWTYEPATNRALAARAEIEAKNVRLSKELGMMYNEPDSRLALIKLEHALRREARFVL